MWFCDKCKTVKDAVLEHGQPKVRRFRTGFVGVQLRCGHWVRVAKDKVEK